jgi:D-mannonate dehydratase
MIVNIRNAAALLALAIAAACGQADDSAARGTAVPDSLAGAAESANGMPAMPGMQGSGTTEEMQAHMRTMHGVGGDSLKAMLPMHRQMAANMIAQMNREMRDMNMTADAGWTATVDSLRQDLVRMPEMDAEELGSYMPAHQGRLNRLMEMHGEMMRKMGM